MKQNLRRLAPLCLAAFCAFFFSNCANGLIARTNSANSSGSEIERASRRALSHLHRTNPRARELTRTAEGVLVFPEIMKGGLMFGGMGGNGAFLWPDSSVGGFYQTAGISYGLQAGLQKYAYALFLMDKRAVQEFTRSEGWEIGSDPNVVVVDMGKAASLSTSTMKKGTYAFFFNQKGLMGGVTLQGVKITRIHPNR